MAPRDARGSVWGQSPWNADRVVAIASGSSRIGIRDAADSVMNLVLEASGSRDGWFVPTNVNPGMSCGAGGRRRR